MPTTKPRKELFSPQRAKLQGRIFEELQAIASETLFFYSKPLHREHLYSLLVPAEHLDTLKRASALASPRYSFVSSLIIPTTTDSISISLARHPNFSSIHWKALKYSLVYYSSTTNSTRIWPTTNSTWIWPDDLNPITPENELGKHLMPCIDIAIRWATTHLLFNKFFMAVPSIPLITYMLPWLCTIIEKLPRSSYTDQYLKKVTPRYIPSVSKWFGEACDYGTELIGLHSLLRNSSIIETFEREATVTIIPHIDASWAEDGVHSQFEDFDNQLNINSSISGEPL